MRTPQQAAVRMLWKSQVAAGGVLGRYRRGANASLLRVVPARVDQMSGYAEEMPILDTDSAWIILADNLIVDGEEIKPQEGDSLTIDRGGELFSYEVFPPNEMEQCWRYTDQSQVIIRFHTKLREVKPDE